MLFSGDLIISDHDDHYKMYFLPVDCFSIFSFFLNNDLESLKIDKKSYKITPRGKACKCHYSLSSSFFFHLVLFFIFQDPSHRQFCSLHAKAHFAPRSWHRHTHIPIEHTPKSEAPISFLCNIIVLMEWPWETR